MIRTCIDEITMEIRGLVESVGLSVLETPGAAREYLANIYTSRLIAGDEEASSVVAALTELLSQPTCVDHLALYRSQQESRRPLGDFICRRFLGGVRSLSPANATLLLESLLAAVSKDGDRVIYSQPVNGDTPDGSKTIVNGKLDLAYEDLEALSRSMLTDDSFVLWINNSYSSGGRGLVVWGPFDHGTIRVGDAMQLIGSTVGVTEATVLGIRYKEKSYDSFSKRNYENVSDQRAGISVLLRHNTEHVPTGTVLATPQAIGLCQTFRCSAYFLNASESGYARTRSINSGESLDFWLRVSGAKGTIRCAPLTSQLEPGCSYSFDVELAEPMPIEKGLMLPIVNKNSTIGAAVVTELDVGYSLGAHAASEPDKAYLNMWDTVMFKTKHFTDYSVWNPVIDQLAREAIKLAPEYERAEMQRQYDRYWQKKISS